MVLPKGPVPTPIPAHAVAAPPPWTALIPGLLLTGLIAAVAMAAGALPTLQGWGLSALTLAILIGIVLGNTVFPRITHHAAAGVDVSRSRLLRIGIVLYGFRVTLHDIAGVGITGIVIDATMVTLVFALAVWLGARVFKLDRETSMLIGAGSAICGAAAVMATEPVLRAPAHKVSVAVATVVVFGTLSMLLYPLLYPLLGLSQHAYGVYAGSTIHEVAQVVVAGRAIGPAASDTAVIEKLLRVSAFNSLKWLPVAWTTRLLQLDTILLAMAMAGLGLRTHAGAIRQAGARPLLLATLLFVFLIVGGWVVNATVTRAIALLGP